LAIKVYGVFLVAGQRVAKENLEEETLRRKATGRPPFKWDEFHVEIARRLKSTELPAKQEAFIAEMQQWCSQKWGFDR
jgi:hypothetical protein